MRRIMAILAVFGVAGVALALNVPTPPPGPSGSPAKGQPANEKFAVHEWGTFTGFAGSDGVHLAFGTNLGGDLPPFVLSRRTQAIRDNPKVTWFDFGKGGGVF